MLESAGFTDIDVRGGHTDQPATAEHDFLVYVTRR
jgi:hypothetical protein